MCWTRTFRRKTVINGFYQVGKDLGNILRLVIKHF